MILASSETVPGTVLPEAKNGPCALLAEEEIMKEVGRNWPDTFPEK